MQSSLQDGRRYDNAIVTMMFQQGREAKVGDFEILILTQQKIFRPEIPVRYSPAMIEIDGAD